MSTNGPAHGNRAIAFFASYGLTVLLVAAATAACWGLEYALGPFPTFITFYPALILAALIGGLGPGLAATALGGLAADYFFIPPMGSLKTANLNDRVALALFFLIGALISVIADRLRKVRAEQLKWESEQRWATTLASIGDAVIAADVAGRITFMNAAAEAATGWKREAASMKSVTEVFNIINEQTRRKVDNPVARVLKEGVVMGLANHTVLIRKDGTEVPVDDSGAPIKDKDGSTIGVVLIFHDVADRKRAEEIIRESEERFRSVFEHAAVGMVVVDPDGRILQSNPAFRMMLGYSDDEFRKMRFVDFTHPGDVEMSVELVSRTYAGDSAAGSFEKRYVAKDGREIWAHISLAVVYAQAGRPRYHVAVVEDVTERKQAEAEKGRLLAELESRVRERTAELQTAYDWLKEETEERSRVEEQLRHAQKMQAIGTLAGGIAHDFNNMLAVIMGNAELAYDDVNDDAPKRNIEQILAASKRSRDLVKQILAFSRKTEPGKTALKLRSLVEDTMGMLRGSLPSSIRMEFDVLTESDVILGDAAQIQQVLMNLATNAAHAMSEKGGVLSISLAEAVLRKDAPMPDSDMSLGPYVKLTVSDTGAGMRGEVLKRIFEPFFTTKEVGQGTGMGLPVAYGIVKSHGGAITAESAPGKGSTFTVFLPHAPVGESLEKEEREDVPRGAERVLLIDDEPLVVETTSRTLERLGYQVVAALSGSEALEIFLRGPDRFDVVIADQIMPDLAGMDLAAKMLETRRDLPIILVTGYSETASSEKAKSAGISEFVMKPIVKKQLAETIRRVLDSQK